MQHLSTLLRFHEEDCAYRSVEDLSVHGRISQGFIRLCLAAGCPAQSEKVSLAGLLEWLFGNYTAVRELAGLGAVPSLAGVEGTNLGKLRMGNAMLTLLEYSELRASKVEDKEQIAEIRRCIELALDRQ